MRWVGEPSWSLCPSRDGKFFSLEKGAGAAESNLDWEVGELASVSALPLFLWLWEKHLDSWCPVCKGKKKSNKVICTFLPTLKWMFINNENCKEFIEVQYLLLFLIILKEKNYSELSSSLFRKKKGGVSFLFEKHQGLLCPLIVAWVEVSMLAQSGSTGFQLIPSLYTPNLTRGTGRVRQCVGRLKKIRKV